MRSPARLLPWILAVATVVATAATDPPEAVAGGGGGVKPCRPATCKSLGYECGTWPDGCGGVIECGVCPEGIACVEGTCEVGEAWEAPVCSTVVGTRAVTFTTDEGATMADTAPLQETTYTFGLVALDSANTLLATLYTSAGDTLLRSEDSGCSWSEVAVVDVRSVLYLEGAPGGQAYAWTSSSAQFFRYDGATLSPRTAPGNVYGLAVDPEDPLHIRIGGYDCQIRESLDGGLTFFPVGGPAGSGGTLFYTTEFDPRDWNRVLCGGVGGWITTDAGRSWQAIVPLDLADSDVTFRFVFSPSDPGRVWARVNLGASERVIMLSNDGGATFDVALTQGATATDQNGVVRSLTLTNQPPMAAHPSLADVLYVVYGTDFMSYGTDLFRFDAGQGALSVTHTDGLHGIDAMEFCPADPSVMYLGLERVVY